MKTNNPEKPVKLMAHMMAAQQVWINRCKRLPAAGGVLWPDWPAETLSDKITESAAQWIEFLSQQNNEDFDKLISYTDLKGNAWENKLSDILAHVINHGTHHRAQAGQHLILSGVEKLPITDYIFFIRAMNYT